MAQVSEALVEIQSVAAGGSGVARANGMVCFVPRSAPGDRGRVRLTSRGRYAFGSWIELLEPSKLRVPAECQHYVADDCGGCQLQHLRYDSQLSAKARIVGDAMRRIGGREVDDPRITPSPTVWRYRRKLTLAMKRTAEGWMAGLHRQGDPASVFALRDCLIASEDLNQVWREAMQAAEFLPQVGELRGSAITVAGGTAFLLEGAADWTEHAAFLRACPAVTELWWQPDGARPRLLGGTSGDGSTGISFVQVNQQVAALIREHALEQVLAFRPERLVDAYCGTGELAALLAPMVPQVWGIELNEFAAGIASKAAGDSARIVHGDVAVELPSLLPVDVLVLNPPRAGVTQQVAAAIASPGAVRRAVVYVSCDAATLARDVARFGNGYSIGSLHCFDMFPHTAHVETVCVLRPQAA